MPGSPPTSSPCSTWANKTGSLMVTELMGCGDVEGLVEDSPKNRVPMEQAMRISRAACRGLEFAHSRNIVHRDLYPRFREELDRCAEAMAPHLEYRR